jgi:hypothetical protein
MTPAAVNEVPALVVMAGQDIQACSGCTYNAP